MTAKKRIVFVVNPISGTQGKKAILKWIDERIDRALFDYSIVKTQYAGHAVEIAAAAAKDNVDIVVAIGGDGTINEIGRSLVHTNTALGIIPCGSGNGLARHLHIPMDAKAAIDLLNTGECTCVDYGKRHAVFLHMRCGLRCLCELEICRFRQKRLIDLSGKYLARKPDLRTRNLRNRE